MQFKKQRNYDERNTPGGARMSGVELFDLRQDLRMEAGFERLALGGIRENLGGNAPALGRIGYERMRHIVGIENLDAKFFQIR